MAYQEKTRITFHRQDVVTPKGREECYLVVQSLEIGPGQFKPTSYGPELRVKLTKLPLLVALRSMHRQIELIGNPESAGGEGGI